MGANNFIYYLSVDIMDVDKNCVYYFLGETVSCVEPKTNCHKKIEGK